MTATVAVAGAGPSGEQSALALARVLEAACASEPGVVVLERYSHDADVLIVMGVLPEALERLPLLVGARSSHRLVVSAVAGLTLEDLREAVGPGPSLCRMLDGPGVVVGEGAVVLAPGPEADPDLIEALTGMLSSAGTVEVVAEGTLDALSAVTVAGVGFLLLALEGMEHGAVEAGLPLEIARPFVRQTALATALLLKDHPGSPADLKDQVASPGGTTIAGLAALEDAGVRGAFIRAVEDAAAGPDGKTATASA